MLPCLCLLQYSIVAAAESIQRKRIFGTPALLLVFGGRPVLPPHYHNAFVLDSEQHYIHFRVTVRLHCNLLKK